MERCRLHSKCCSDLGGLLVLPAPAPPAALHQHCMLRVYVEHHPHQVPATNITLLTEESSSHSRGRASRPKPQAPKLTRHDTASGSSAGPGSLV